MEMQRIPSLYRRPEHHNDNFGYRGRSSIDRERPRQVADVDTTSVPTLPIALSSMLKTTTETGDIGQFSIRSVRGSGGLSGASPSQHRRRPVHDFRYRNPYSPRPRFQHAVIDDRRGLPSYTDDFIDRTVQSSRVPGRHEQRSYSLTQASYSPYTVSSRRFNASPRSQPERPRPLQRPRSPFVYPTRLKRPGFRPSSPALTDGGVVDYSRRVEIGRAHYENSIPLRIAPSALYARRRLPCYASSYSPVSFERTPFVASDRGIQEWGPNSSAVSGKLSPACSSVSLVSDTNAFRQEPPRSTATISGRSLPPPSPRYYDYTEEFHVDGLCFQPAAVTSGTPPPFSMSKPIPEDRELSSEWSSLIASQDSYGYSNPSQSTFPTSSGSSTKHHYSGSTIETPEEHGIGSNEDKARVGTMPVTTSSADTEKIAIFSHHDREMAVGGKGQQMKGSTPHYSKSVAVRHHGQRMSEQSLLFHADESGEHSCNVSVAELDDTSFLSNRSSNHTLSNHLPVFPNPPGRQDSCPISYMGSTHHEQRLLKAKSKEKSLLSLDNAALRSVISELETPPPKNSLSTKLPSESFYDKALQPEELLEPVLGTDYHLGRAKYQTLASPCYMLKETNASDLVPEVDILELKEQRGSSDDVTSRRLRDLSITDSAQNVIEPQNASAQEVENMPSSTPSKMDDILIIRNELADKHEGDLALESSCGFSVKSNNSGCMITKLSKVAHQMPQDVLSRPCTPILAPTAISLAKICKLTNGVPHLMKALPPLPNKPFLEVCKDEQPAVLRENEEDLFKRLPLLETPGTSRKVPRYDRGIGVLELNSAPVSLQKSLREEPDINYYPQRLKLNSDSPAAVQSPTSLTTGPWNSNATYPWMDDQLNARLPSTISDGRSNTQDIPKFKLKVTRASMASAGPANLYNVGVDKRYRSGRFVKTDAHQPKDLFAQSPGIGGVIRYVSRHLGTQRSLPQDDQTSLDIPRLRPPPAGIRTGKVQGRAASFDVGSSQTASKLLDPTSPVQSFFSDDSSQVCIEHGLRQKINSLRARLPVSYNTRSPATRSHDDIVWRAHHQQPPLLDNSAWKDQAQPHVSPTVCDAKRVMAGVRRQRFRSKVSEWYKEARGAFKGCAKKKRDSDQVPLQSGA